MRLRRLRTAAAVLVTAAASGLLTLGGASPAGASACPGSGGVTVVVEYGALGGGTDVDCAPEGGGHTAERLLKDAGHSLEYVQRFPAFVCRIDGVPADDPCVNTPPADAYWGLWWSDGKSGKWSYSSLAAGSLNIPAGGYVAMVWDGSAGDVRPRTDPTAHATPTPTPTPTPTKKPTSQAPTPVPTQDPTQGPTASPTSSAPGEPTASPSRTKKPRPSKTQSPSDTTTTPEPTAEPSSDQQTEAAGPVDDPVDPASSTSDGGLPPWVAPIVVVVLLASAGGVALTRRRREP